MLSEKDLKLVNESIEKWRAIEDGYLSGDSIVNDDAYDYWENSEEVVDLGLESCPLCMEYNRLCIPYSGHGACPGCPLKKVGKECCVDESNPYDAFIDNMCLETCQGMIKALEDLKSNNINTITE